MADVILVQPKAGGYSATVQRPMLPHALLAAARRIVGTRSVRIIDFRVDDNWRGRLETILSTEPVCVGITSITGSQLRSAVKAASLVREQGDVPIVWGGVHASLLPDQTLASGLADVVVIGDGDETFPRLVDALAEGRDLSRIDGIAFRKGKRTVHTKPAPFVDLDEQPDLPYNLVDIEEYVQMYDGRRTLVVQTSRGCPHSCRFCVNPCYNSSKWRGQSADRVQDVFASMRERFGVENLWLADDNFFVDMSRARAIARGLVESGSELTWEVPGTHATSVLAMREGTLGLMQNAGCRRMYIGVESGSDRVLKAIGKTITVDKVLKANKLLADTEIIPTYNFILGFPGETGEEVQATIDLVFRLLDENPQAEVAPLYCFTPYPGTVLYDEAVEAGFEPPGDLDGWADFEWSRLNVPWLDEEQRRRLESLYFYSLFLDRKYRHDLDSPQLQALARIYSPVARARVRNMFLDAPLELKLKRWLLGGP